MHVTPLGPDEWKRLKRRAGVGVGGAVFGMAVGGNSSRLYGAIATQELLEGGARAWLDVKVNVALTARVRLRHNAGCASLNARALE